MGRAKKLYKPERDMKRGYCEWIPDSYAGKDGGEFIQRLLRKMLVPTDKGFSLRPLDPKDIEWEKTIEKIYKDKEYFE